MISFLNNFKIIISTLTNINARHLTFGISCNDKQITID